MKKFKLTWILAGVLVLSLVYVYVIEVKWAEQKAEVKEQKERVVQFDKDKVESLLLRNPNGTFEAKRIGEDGWELVRPLKASGDKLTWNNILTQVHELKSTRVLEEATKDLNPFGLLAPEFTVEINIKGGGTVILKVGEDNPIGDSRFATDSSGKKVVLIPKKITYTIDKDLKDLRNKRLFSYDTEKTQEIEILKKGKRLVLKKEGEKWFVVSGKEKKEADDMKVTRIVSGLNVLQVKEFEHEAPADLKKYGLSTPKGMVTVRDDKTTQLHLLIGNGDKDGVFVSKKAEKPVYKVAKSILKRLETDPNKLLKEEKKKKKTATPKS